MVNLPDDDEVDSLLGEIYLAAINLVTAQIEFERDPKSTMWRDAVEAAADELENVETQLCDLIEVAMRQES